jgi:uncharacterized membrane protein (UPF0136 family)
MKWQALVVLIYGLFILAGGIIGFVKAQSHASLWIGATASLILIVASIGIYNFYPSGLFLAFGATTLLMFFFGYRYFLKQAFFPSGMMMVLSVITLLVLSFLPRK